VYDAVNNGVLPMGRNVTTMMQERDIGPQLMYLLNLKKEASGPAAQLRPGDEQRSNAQLAETLPNLGNRAMKTVEGESVPFKEFKVKVRDLEGVIQLVLKGIKQVILDNGYDLKGPLNPDDMNWKNYAPGWRWLYLVILVLAENLEQHEYIDGELVVMRVFKTTDLYNGIRIEFWGPGKVGLPHQLTEQKWFSRVDRPWQDKAPPSARSATTSRQGRAIANLFRYLDDLEEYWEMSPDEHIMVGWREDQKNEGPQAGGHIIAIHIPVFQSVGPRAEASRDEHSSSSYQQAMKAGVVDKEGGIDLTPANWNLRTKMDSGFSNDGGLGNDRGGIKFHPDAAMLQQFQDSPGLTVGSVTIKPLRSLTEFLGVSADVSGPKLTP
jgi:hypothetical protein